MCLDWSGYGVYRHTRNFWNISHADCAKILNDDIDRPILDGIVLGDMAI